MKAQVSGNAPSIFKDSAALFLINAIVFAWNTLGFFSQPFFRDYSIVFEGGYRILLGQVPYRDFFLPVGPVIFYLQAFFNRMLGANLWAMAVHAGVQACLLASVYYWATRKKWHAGFAILMSVATLFSFNPANYPWYNQTAYLFFLINIMLVITQVDRPSMTASCWIGSVALTLLSFFSKQDVGLLQFVLLGIFFMWQARPRLVRPFCFYVLPVVFLFFLIAWAYESAGQFFYWFNLGQLPHTGRLHHFLKIRNLFHSLISWKFLGLLFCGWNLFRTDLPRNFKARYFILAMLLAVPWITGKTSGLVLYTVWQGFPVLLFLVYELVQQAHPAWVQRYQKLVYFVLFYVVLIGLKPVAQSVKYLGTNLATFSRTQSSPWGLWFQKRYKLQDYARIKEGSYQHSLLRKDAKHALQKIRGVIQAHGGNFINLTEYTFLYADFKQIPPAGFPLWFDNGVTLFELQKQWLGPEIIRRQPQVLLLQNTYDRPQNGLVQSLLPYVLAHGYEQAFIAPAAVKDREIWVLTRKANVS